ncbi:unnamed protein product [Agarophyton chilense]
MASQTDRKEEFRKYLDKGNVLSILTNVLTDLFEMEPKPEDPAQYLHQRIGEAVYKDKTAATPNHTEAPQKDVEMKDNSQTTPAQQTKPADTETSAQKQSAQESGDPKPAPPEQAKLSNQQPSQTEPVAATPATSSASAAPVSVPATNQ